MLNRILKQIKSWLSKAEEKVVIAETMEVILTKGDTVKRIK